MGIMTDTTREAIRLKKKCKCKCGCNNQRMYANNLNRPMADVCSRCYNDTIVVRTYFAGGYAASQMRVCHLTEENY